MADVREVIEKWATLPGGIAGRDVGVIWRELMEMDFDPKIHFPMTYLHIYYAFLNHHEIWGSAEDLLNKAPDKTDPTYLHLNDYYQALLECDESYVTVFPLTVPWRDWWNGPHLDFPKELNGVKMTQWNPAKIEWIEGDTVTLHVGKKEDEKIVYGNVKIKKDKLNIDLPDGIADDYGDNTCDNPSVFLELAFYDEELLAKCHNPYGSWEQPVELQELREVIRPIIDAINRRVQEFSDSFYRNKEERVT